MQSDLFPTRPDDHHRLMERMVSTRVTDQQARAIMADPEEHRQFIVALCAGMQWAAGKRS